MKRRLSTWALLTGASFLCTVLLVGGRSVDADGESLHPALVVDGVELAVAHQSFRGPPTARLTARNTTGEPAEVAVELRLLATRMPPPESRMGPMAEETWHRQELLVLAPGEERTIPIVADAPLPPRSTGRFVVRAGRQEVRTAQFRGRLGPEERVRVERAVVAPASAVQHGKVVKRRGPAGKRGKAARATLARARSNSLAQLAE